MKQIFDWMREQTKKMSFLLTHQNFSAVWSDDVYSIINEAELMYEEDVCEWQELTWNIYKAHEMIEGESVLKKWKYCPYCGKKIKAVCRWQS